MILRGLGAPDTCYLISEDTKFDGKEMELLAALKQIVGYGMGTVISCIPGRLGYFEGELKEKIHTAGSDWLPMPDSEWIRKLCLSLPDATEDMPWADDLCFKVRGKIFTGMALSEGRFSRVSL